MPAAIASPGPWNAGDLAVDEDLALVGRVQPVQDVHQGALARAVLAQQAVDLAGLDDEVDVIVRDERAEPLRDAAQLELHRDLSSAGDKDALQATAVSTTAVNTTAYDAGNGQKEQRWGGP